MGSPVLLQGSARRCVRDRLTELVDSTVPMCFSGPVARVLLFNATGERDSAAMLKLLVVSICTVILGGGQFPSPPTPNVSPSKDWVGYGNQTCYSTG